MGLFDIETKTTDSTPDPMMAILFVFMSTTIYCIVAMFVTNKKYTIIMKLAYILFVVSGEFFINLTLSNSMCGVQQWGSTFIITVVPWTLIFGVIQVIMIMFPGWLSPFSNTFGYLVTKLMGLPELMGDILLESTDKEGEVARALENVRSDNSLFLNQLMPDEDKFDTTVEKLVKGGILKSTITSGKGTLFSDYEKLYNFVTMKRTIAEYVWNLLTGFLVTSISYNYIISQGCSKSPKEMKSRRDAYEAAEVKKVGAAKKSSNNQPEYVQT